ncbi:hypothetical protein CYFUS_004239 [Cystobacter fuscus]|uniref:Uncharacterized protein n=1 Tax=Cystobacter fuscus TaxID=43 RepID=A0A250J4B3_9BACT|nr:hypothetical protein [Cystobacter fuscus]ATB38804.1 hypothetical protein CYFUS_004239 [Cystobacter fuscus]
MPKLVVHVFATDMMTHSDLELARLESDRYDPDHLEDLVQKCLTNALSSDEEKRRESGMLAMWQVFVDLFVDEHESVRPSLHLSGKTVQLLAEAKAEFDFDPYV